MTINVRAILFAAVVVAGCGGKSQPAPAQPEPMPEPVAANPEPAAPPPAAEPAPPPAPAPPPPPPPKVWKAKVELAPVKGAKLKPAVVSFTQEEGKSTVVAAEAAFEGLKPGTYYLVLHEAAECGPNATKAGKIIPDAANVTIKVAKDSPAAIETSEVQLALDGDKSIVGKTLVLHTDKAGKPHKAQACGAIAMVEGGEAAPGAAAGAGAGTSKKE